MCGVEKLRQRCDRAGVLDRKCDEVKWCAMLDNKKEGANTIWKLLESSLLWVWHGGGWWQNRRIKSVCVCAASEK